MADDLTSTELERLLTLDEVAYFLGIPKNTIYRWRVDGLGPRASKVGKHLRYRRRDLEAWLDANADDAGSRPAA